MALVYFDGAALRFSIDRKHILSHSLKRINTSFRGIGSNISPISGKSFDAWLDGMSCS